MSIEKFNDVEENLDDLNDLGKNENSDERENDLEEKKEGLEGDGEENFPESKEEEEPLYDKEERDKD